VAAVEKRVGRPSKREWDGRRKKKGDGRRKEKGDGRRK